MSMNSIFSSTALSTECVSKSGLKPTLAIWFEACPALFLLLLSQTVDMDLCYVTIDLPDKKTATNQICGDEPLNSGSQSPHIETTQCIQKLHICANTSTKTSFSLNSPKTQHGSEVKRNSEWGWEILEESGAKRPHIHEKEAKERQCERRCNNTSDESVSWTSLSFLPEAVRLWEILQADGQLKTAPPSSPHLLCIRSLVEPDILASLHISSFKNYTAVNVGQKGKLPLNRHSVHSNIRKLSVQHITKR